MDGMGRLIASVREAEERLAGLARALQSAWEEEVAEASSAREAARRSLHKADAMAEAAGHLGRQELAARLAAVVQQLRSVEERASSRLEVLMRTERDLQLRLEAPPARSLPVTPVPWTEPPPPQVRAEPTPAPVEGSRSEPEAWTEPTPAPGEAPVDTPPVSEEVTAAPVIEEIDDAEIEIVSGDEDAEEVILEVDAEITAPPAADPVSAAPVIEEAGPAEAEAAEPTPPPPSEPPPPPAPAEGLTRRVSELERVAARLPVSVLEPALEELVALTRLMGRNADAARSAQAAGLRERLRVVAARRGKERTFGLSDDEFADWASLAVQARARRQAEVERVKAARPRTSP